jgi:hypothetical protein
MSEQSLKPFYVTIEETVLVEVSVKAKDELDAQQQALEDCFVAGVCGNVVRMPITTEKIVLNVSETSQHLENIKDE